MKNSAFAAWWAAQDFRPADPEALARLAWDAALCTAGAACLRPEAEAALPPRDGHEIHARITRLHSWNPNPQPHTTMKPTESTRRSFHAALVAVLSTDRDTWPEPVIYAEEINGEMVFGACNRPALSGSEIVWLHVEPDSFGDLTGDPQADADGIEANCYEQALQDTEAAIG